MEMVTNPMKEDVYSIEEGRVIVQWPSNLSAKSFKIVKEYLKILELKLADSVTHETSIRYEAFQDRDEASNWRVEGIDSKAGDVFIAIFAGPIAEERAAEYADFKNKSN